MVEMEGQGDRNEVGTTWVNGARWVMKAVTGNGHNVTLVLFRGIVLVGNKVIGMWGMRWVTKVAMIIEELGSGMGGRNEWNRTTVVAAGWKTRVMLYFRMGSLSWEVGQVVSCERLACVE